ncbi:MAG: hypothetical protein KDI82_04800 [Gammaproteobacteria bacterium]|nr:hypothetical protein [Gammaproteobacteria bacterium]
MKQIAAAGTLIGSLLAASATVTAISVTGTLDLRALVPGVSDALGLAGARVTLVVDPGPALDDDDSGSLADSTVLDGNAGQQSLSISGSDTLDGEYIPLASEAWTQLQRDTGSDRILLGGGEFLLDSNGLVLQLAGVSLDMPLGSLTGPDSNGEYGLPASNGGTSPGVGNGGGSSGPAITVSDGNGNPLGSYSLNDLAVDLGDDVGDDNGTAENGAADAGNDGTGGEQGDSGEGGNDPQLVPQLLVELDPGLTSGQQDPQTLQTIGADPEPGSTSSAARVPAPATWLLLLAGIACLRRPLRRT